MALDKQTHPREFLFVWNDLGQPQGCHIAYRESVREDGVEVANKMLDPRPVGLADADKLAEIGANINTATMVEVQTKTATLITRTAERDDLQAALTSTQATLATVQAELDALKLSTAADAEAKAALAHVQAELDALKASQAPVINGVPQVVTKFKGCAALYNAGHLDTIEALMAHPDTPPLIKLAWKTAQVFERPSQMIAQMATVMGWTDEYVDALFVAADQIKD